MVALPCYDSLILLSSEVFSDLRHDRKFDLRCASYHSDGPHADPSMVRPSGPNQMVSRMQNPAGETHRRARHNEELFVTSRNALCKRYNRNCFDNTVSHFRLCAQLLQE